MPTIDALRPGVPTKRSMLDAVPRPRLFTVLDRQASLTVLHAPPGFGKSTLVANWLHHGGARERAVVWTEVSASEPVDAEALAGALTGDARRILVVAGVPAEHADDALDRIGEVLERCPSVVAVMTVHGAIAPRPDPRGLERRWIDAHNLCFSTVEIAELCRHRGLSLGEERCAELGEALGGVPPLVAAAVDALQIAPAAPITADRRLVPAVERIVRDHVRRGLSHLDDRTRAFASDVALLRTCTARDAEDLTGFGSCEDALARLDAAGLMLGSFDGTQQCWSWPPAVREMLLDEVRRDRPGRVEEVLARLADERLAQGRYADAAVYAVDAQKWDVAVRIVEDQWSHLVSDDHGIVVFLLRALPDEVAERHPAVAAGKALFVQTLTGHPILQVDLPDDPDEIDEVGAGPDADDMLYVGTVQAIALRIGGCMKEASARVDRLAALADSIVAHQPHNITAQLPTIRLQWAIGMQLAGDLSASTVEFERAYRDALSGDIGFVLLNAAGSIAANWAMAGDLSRAEEWLVAESWNDVHAGAWNEMIRVGGRVAAALVHLDRLEPDAAQQLLDLLGVPAVREELWALVAYAHAQFALSTGDPYTGLTLLHRILDGHRHLHQAGALSDALLTSAEIDLQLALGNANLARAAAEADGTGHPLVVVATARTELLTGHPDTARAVLRRVSWPDCGWPRAHLEALLIDAAACLPTDRDEAARTWARAVALAELVGNRSVFATLPSRVRHELAAAAGIPEPAASPDAMYPETVEEIVLTAREREILVHLDRGVARQDLAEALFVSYNTVKTQLRSIYGKLGVHSVTEALTRARELRLLQ